MQLVMHDRKGSTVETIGNIDLDAQAEKQVELWMTCRDVSSWVLKDAAGTRCVWERTWPAGPEVTQRAPRYRGEWPKGHHEVPIQ